MIRHRLLNFVSVVSLLLCATTAVLWVRSYWRVTAMFYHLNGVSIAAVVLPGTIELGEYKESAAWPYRWRVFDEVDDPVINPNGRGDEFVTYLLFEHALARIPFWLLIGLEIILPLWWMVARFKVPRIANEGLCPRCGYNLTGNVSGVCPECGAAVARKLAEAKA